MQPATQQIQTSLTGRFKCVSGQTQPGTNHWRATQHCYTLVSQTFQNTTSHANDTLPTTHALVWAAALARPSPNY